MKQIGPHKNWMRLASLLVAQAFFCSNVLPSWATPLSQKNLSTLRPTTVKDGGNRLGEIRKEFATELPIVDPPNLEPEIIEPSSDSSVTEPDSTPSTVWARDGGAASRIFVVNPSMELGKRVELEKQLDAAVWALTLPVQSNDPEVQRLSRKIQEIFGDPNLRINVYLEDMERLIRITPPLRNRLPRQGTAGLILFPEGPGQYQMLYEKKLLSQGPATLITGLSHEFVGHFVASEKELEDLSPLEVEARAYQLEVKYLEALLSDRNVVAQIRREEGGDVVKRLRILLQDEKENLVRIERRLKRETWLRREILPVGTGVALLGGAVYSFFRWRAKRIAQVRAKEGAPLSHGSSDEANDGGRGKITSFVLASSLVFSSMGRDRSFQEMLLQLVERHGYQVTIVNDLSEWKETTKDIPGAIGLIRGSRLYLYRGNPLSHEAVHAVLDSDDMGLKKVEAYHTLQDLVKTSGQPKLIGLFKQIEDGISRYNQTLDTQAGEVIQTPNGDFEDPSARSSEIFARLYDNILGEIGHADQPLTAEEEAYFDRYQMVVPLPPLFEAFTQELAKDPSLRARVGRIYADFGLPVPFPWIPVPATKSAQDGGQFRQWVRIDRPPEGFGVIHTTLERYHAFLQEQPDHEGMRQLLLLVLTHEAERSKMAGDLNRAILYTTWTGVEASWFSLGQLQTVGSVQFLLAQFHEYLKRSEAIFAEVPDGPFVFEGLLQSMHLLLQKQLEKVSSPALQDLYRTAFLDLSSHFGGFLRRLGRATEATKTYEEALRQSHTVNDQTFFREQLNQVAQGINVANDGGLHGMKNLRLETEARYGSPALFRSP